jgi:hypothetical protein
MLDAKEVSLRSRIDDLVAEGMNSNEREMEMDRETAIINLLIDRGV